MKVTFPHMGNVYITAKVLLDELGVEYVIPPFNNKEALEMGMKIAPESACLPLKINLGNFIQAHGQGADTIIMAGGCGPCRFGYYGVMEKEILQDAGFDMEIIMLEMYRGHIKEFMEKIKKLTGRLDLYKIYKVLKKTAEISRMVDELERLTYKVRPREIKPGGADRVYKTFREDIKKVYGYEGMKAYIEATTDRLNAIDIDRDYIPMRVGIVGEIYTTIDSHTSFNIDSKLGSLGIEVARPVTISGWIIDHIIKNALHLPVDQEYKEAARPYLETMIGGHAQETVGNSVLFAKEGFDGLVQVYPLTCMPEIVAQSILPNVSKDLDIPVLTLIIDEMSGEAGYLTRLEAFTDLLKKRKEKMQYGEDRVLPGS